MCVASRAVPCPLRGADPRAAPAAAQEAAGGGEGKVGSDERGRREE